MEKENDTVHKVLNVIKTIDNTDYINIVNQIRSDEFEKSVKEAVKNEVEKNNILKEKEYSELKLSYDKNFAELNLVKEKEISEIKTKYDEIIRNKDLAIKDAEDELERVKDHKLSLSTKAVGEDLEQYCKDEFEKLRPVAYRNAYFQKDNQTEDHTKGDFIFRDYDNTIEYISIMFEMKNESDFTKSKQKKKCLN